MAKSSGMIERRNNLSPEEFYGEYVGKKPVIVEGLMREWSALNAWTEGFFLGTQYKGLMVKVRGRSIPMEQFIRELTEYEESMQSAQCDHRHKTNIYLFNVPMLTWRPELRNDVEPFPTWMIPPWYHENWWIHTQFFYGPSNTATALHIDGLGTHNLFFQVRGRKQFILFNPEDKPYCYPQNFSSMRVDPEKPDYEKYPLFRRAKKHECVVSAGDTLYMPPFTVHHVRSLDRSVSFNIDWHTKASSISWIPKIFEGMPRSRIFYNTAYLIGLWFKIPARILYPFYKGYLA